MAAFCKNTDHHNNDSARGFLPGAKGAWVGTTFLASQESVYKDECKQALVDATENSTVITTMFTGKTCRVYKNLLVQECSAE